MVDLTEESNVKIIENWLNNLLYGTPGGQTAAVIALVLTCEIARWIVMHIRR